MPYRNKEDKQAYNRQYHIDNKERLNERSRKYYADNKEQYRDHNKRYRETHKEQLKQYAIDNREHRREKELWRLYKLTGKEFKDKRLNQDNKCAICFVIFVKPYVDHDHTTGKTRDLLCRSCNVALGCVKDNIQVLESAIQYLKKHKNLGEDMSDYNKNHTRQMAGKTRGGNTAMPSPGTDKPSSKNHETDISHGEGLALGSVHPAHTKETVMGAKHNSAPHAAAHAQRQRVISGNSNTMGEGTVTNQENGHQAHVKSNSKVQQKAHAYNERSIAGNANPSAMPDDSEV